MATFQLSIPATGMAAPAFLRSGSPAAKERLDMVFGPLVMEEGFSRPGTAERKKLPPHANLFTQGEMSDHVYVIESGVVKMVHDNGDTKSILGLRSSGCILELSSALLGTPCPCSGVTVTRTVVSRIPVQDFRDALNSDGILLREVNRMLSREIHTEAEQEMELRSATVIERLTRLIREFRAFSGASSQVPASSTSIKQTEVAQMLSITPEHLSRLLRQVRPPSSTPNSLPIHTF